MKILTIGNNKGGVGKSILSTQIAYYSSIKVKLRVAVFDIDAQSDSSEPLVSSGHAVRHDFDIFGSGKIPDVSQEGIHVFVHRDTLNGMERNTDKHPEYLDNLERNLSLLAPHFDLGIIDTPPNQDIRYVAALAKCTHVIAPIQFNQEAVNGVGRLIENIHQIKEALNPGMDFLGMLPNLVVNTDFQQANRKQIETEASEYLLRFADGKTCLINSRTTWAEAQAIPCPIFNIKKTTARDAYKQFKPVADRVLKLMGVSNA